MPARRLSVGRRLAPFVAVIVAAAVLWPLPGSTPMKCTYEGDSGNCETLFYRSAITVSITTGIWGRDVVNDRP